MSNHSHADILYIRNTTLNSDIA